MAGRSTTAAALTGSTVRAYRILTSGLARTAASARTIGQADPGQAPSLWDLGVQDRDGSARLAMAARLPEQLPVPGADEPAGSGWLTLAWSLRGAPHLHRRADMGRVAAAIWPVDAADATARLSGDAARLRADGADPLEAFVAVSTAMREVITAPMVKGAASAAVTSALPARYSGFCAGCGSVHIRELLFRLAALPASIAAVPDTKPIVLAPLARPLPTPTGQRGLAELAAEFYRQYGVATAADVAVHLGTSAAGVKNRLPEDLVAVTVDGARSTARAGDIDTLQQADVAGAASIVRLLPPSDPLLQPRDRAVLTTDSARRKALWPVIGPPGALLAGGGLAGLWRSRASASSLTITVSCWRALTPGERRRLEAEAEIVGAVRGAARTTVVFD